MTNPLHIAFVWHMHQPYYKAARDGVFELPWVRLHALKDYLDMLEILRDHPSLHQTFNLVPSLVEQLLDYQDPAFRDVYWEHTVLPAASLTAEQRAFVVDNLCERSSHPRAQRHPRYLELARKRESCLDQGLDACAALFTTEELRDLQVWFNLAWFDPVYLEREPLADLMSRGRDFHEGDKVVLQAVQQEILGRVVAAYREAQNRGQVELSTSPYYHPILPLLVNTDCARVARADIPLPTRRYAHPEDAAEQVHAAVAFHTRVFGKTPAGMWCSEQAVGEDVIPLLADAGLVWTASDEGVLARSVGTDILRDESGLVRNPDLLYRPYLLDREGKRLAIVFRDRVLSDLVGFTYQSWAPRDAAANLVWRLREIRRTVAGSAEPHLVTIALDGENAWEYYQADGRDFLTCLYESLAADPGFRCVTVSEFLEAAPTPRGLPWLHTGSWIYADFSTWIGDPAHGVAWDLLHDARDAVASRRAREPRAGGPSEQIAGGGVATQADGTGGAAAEAWHHIQIAQGSDWFWWFGRHQESGMDHVWDARFRAHLREAYHLLGEAPPLELFAPILGASRPGGGNPPTARFTPLIDGRISWPEEWGSAGVCRAPRWGTMHGGGSRVLEEFRYGCDEHDLFMMFVPGADGFDPRVTIAAYFGAPPAAGPSDTKGERTGRTRFHGRARTDTEPGYDLAWEVSLALTDTGGVEAAIAGVVDGQWSVGSTWSEAALDQVIEVAVPLERVGVDGQTTLQIVVAAARDGLLAQLLPTQGTVCLDVGAMADRRRGVGDTTGGEPHGRPDAGPSEADGRG